MAHFNLPASHIGGGSREHRKLAEISVCFIAQFIVIKDSIGASMRHSKSTVEIENA